MTFLNWIENEYKKKIILIFIGYNLEVFSKLANSQR